MLATNGTQEPRKASELLNESIYIVREQLELV